MAYWLSYDRDNLVIKYGKGYRMEETVIIKYDFLAGLTTEEDREVLNITLYEYYIAIVHCNVILHCNVVLTMIICLFQFDTKLQYYIVLYSIHYTNITLYYCISMSYYIAILHCRVVLYCNITWPYYIALHSNIT